MRVYPGNMSIMSNLMERLRQQLLGSKTWDYCVLWKLSDDQRFLEFVDCCCGGSERSTDNGGEELVYSCKDVMFQHPRTPTCELLAQLPSSHPLDGINMEILISNQPRWLSFSSVSDLSVGEVTAGTKVLIPIPGGLAELFAAEQVNEDQNVIDYVMSQCTTFMEQEAMSNSSNVGPMYSVADINMVNDLQSNDQNSSDQMKDHIINIKESKSPFSPATAPETLNSSANCDATAPDQIHFLQQFSYEPKNKGRDDFMEVSNDNSFQAADPHQIHQQQQQLNSFKSLSENGFEELMNNATNMHNLHVLDHSAHEQQSQGDFEKGLGLSSGSGLKQEMSLGSRVDSVSESDHFDDEDDPKCRRRATKGQSKNLIAERKRRKKLNERLYQLRSLVPNISKLDRASILGDAIEYVQRLQKEEKDLQNELERNSDDEGAAGHNNNNNMTDHHLHLHQNDISSEVSNSLGAPGFGPDYDHEKPASSFHMGVAERLKRSHEFESANDKAQQMEVQVEVAQLEGNDFFVKVFGEQKRGGFVRLMDALNCLGLEIANVNMTSCISLVSYVFIVKKRDSEIVQAEYLRDSLLEATRNQAGFWTEMAKASENGGGIDQHHQIQCHSHQHQHHLHSHTHHINPFHNHFHHLSN